MDFWSRLLASAGVSNTRPRKDAAKDPAKRLHRFELEYGNLLDDWRHASNLAQDQDAVEKIEQRLQRLTKTLSDETRRPLPHPCIQYAAMKQIYTPIAKIATSSCNQWVINEAILFLATLIESEEENFVENNTFSASLTSLLVRITGSGNNTISLSSEHEARVVELAFNITTKMRLSPEILPVWFKGGNDDQPAQTAPGQAPGPNNLGHSRTPSAVSRFSVSTVNGDPENHKRFAGRTQKRDFPLFYVLMEYIHHEGKIGAFARTGLLYIIEAASSAVALEQWIVESDLSTLMATGLGAQYSQLSRKLVVDYVPDNLPPVLAFSDYEHPRPMYEIESSCSAVFQAHLDAFLSHLLFWQDVLNHCKSVDIKSTLLEHFKVIFLQQLLYPSLLESSDIDGGSSVAVLTYLRRILESLDHPDMINLILHYLLALPDKVDDDDDDAAAAGVAAAASGAAATADEDDSKVSAARKRKSLDLATMLAEASKQDGTTGSGPLLFNLVDLILACLRSHSHQTILVTLQLVSAIIRRHHRYAVITLLRTDSAPGDASHRTMGAHSQEVEYLMSLAGMIGGNDNFEDIYESVVKDTTTKVEGHLCSLKLVSPNVTTSNHGLPTIVDSLPGAPREVRSHTLRPDDPLLNAALDHLETFLLNPVDMNLTLTETILDLAICGFMNLEGWLLRHPSKYTFDEEDDGPTTPGYYDDDSTAESMVAPSLPPEPDSPLFAEYQRKQQLIACRRRPKWTSLPRILVILDQLCKQVAVYRDKIPRFSELLQQRREAFLMADSGASFPPSRMREPPTPNWDSAQTPGLFMPPRSDSHSRSRSRNSSPVGGFESLAQRIFTEFGVPDLLNGGGNSSPSPPPPPPPPRGRPQSLAPGFLGENQAGSRSRSGHSTNGRLTPDSRRDHARAAQMAAFAAMDQSILARKVGSQSGLKGGMQPVGLVLKLEKEEKLRERQRRKQRRETLTEADPDAPVVKVPEWPEGLGKPVELTKMGDGKVVKQVKIAESVTTLEEEEEEEEEEDEDEGKDKDKDNHENEDANAEDEDVPPAPPAKEPLLKDKPLPEIHPDADTNSSDDDDEHKPTPPAKDSPRPGAAAGLAPAVPFLVGADSSGAAGSGPQREGEAQQKDAGAEDETEVTVSHILTNVIMLQSFLFELSALVQVRAGLFDEVRFV